MKQRLEYWNWNVFGDGNKNALASQEELVQIQRKIQLGGYIDSLKQREVNVVARMSQTLHLQESFYKEKAGNQQLQLGDRCTHFFHLETTIKAARKNISLMMIGDQMVEHEKQIADHVV